MGNSESLTGGSAQTVGRAVQLLRLVASSRSRQVKLVDLAAMAGLDKSTAHRLLQRLVAERMLARDPGQRGYRLGPLLYELGLAAFPESNLREVAQATLAQLAHQTGDMAFLLMRSGFESVCLDRVAGNFAIQTMTAGIGDRHPLGVGAGSMAILSAMDDDSVERVLAATTPQLARYGIEADSLRQRVAETRARGHSLDEGRASMDVTALGRAIRDGSGAPVGAVFVASIKARMTPVRLTDVARQLAAAVKTIESALGAGGREPVRSARTPRGR
jgi:DNA-binding IclR family transcriptional regulator